MPGVQMSLAESLLDPGLGSNARLEALSRAIDWGRLERLVEGVRPGGGRPPYPAGAMLRALYLQTLYDLSDAGLSEALADRLSFRRFCGFSFEAPTPDASTICRFRLALGEANLLSACFEEVNRQLDVQGLILRRGTLVDATLVAAASRRPGRGSAAGAGVGREPGAGWTKKNGRSHFGYRLHVGVDEGSILIRRLALTPARVNESCVAEALICGDEGAVYGDKGYESKERRRALRERKIKDRICHRSHKNQKALPYWQGVRNKGIARRRAPVERVFATMKRAFGFVRARSVRFRSTLNDALRFATVHNLLRALAIEEARHATPRPAEAR